jgi:glycosyltransferase involved in cell wall biosynthesis/GT2 family glycosyltransferase
MAPPVEVVVVAYGTPALLDRCLTTLGGTYPVIIVDNSSDAAVRAVAEQHRARYIDPGRNLGFGAGVNLALAQRTGSGDVLLLNPDATITPGGVAELSDVLHAHPRLGCVAPAQLDPSTCESARVAWPFPTPFGAWVEAVGLGGLRRRQDFMIGSILLLRSEALTEVGPFDEQFFLYAEETDWQRRARNQGWRAAFCPQVTATHVGAGTGGNPTVREIHFHASHERYVRKHYGPWGWRIYRVGVMAGAVPRAILLPGGRGRPASDRFHLYREGPCRAEARLHHGRPAEVSGSPASLSIVHVVLTDVFAGVERYVCQVANQLSSGGHRVTVVGGDPFRMRAELVGHVRHHPAASILDGARALTHERHADVVHVHMTAAEGAAWLARPVQRSPIVATRHFAQDRGSSRVARTLARITSRPISRDIAISRFVADSIRGPSVLLPNGVLDQAPAEVASSTVVMMQRLETEKSPEIGVRAWASSGLGTRGWRLVIAGSGHLQPSLRALARDLEVDDSVDFTGQVTDTDQLLAASSVFLAPAQAEPFGLSVVEAMAHGLPVVAANGGAHVETVGEDGFLFPPGDAESAARALIALSNDIDLRRHMGARLRKRQQEMFSLCRHTEHLELIYRDVIGGAGRPAR